MKQLQLLILSCFFLACSDVGFSQNNQDVQTWITLDAAYEFPWKTELAIENESRFYNNSSLFGRNQTDFSVSYIFNKHWTAGLGYRAKLSYPFSEYTMLTHRFFTEVKWKTRLSKKYRINARFRVINDQESLSESPFGELLHREKFRFGYKIPETRFTIYTGFETYFPVNTINPFLLEKLRIETGMRYEMTQNTEISLDVIVDREFYTPDPDNLIAFQLGFSIDLSRSEE